MPSPNAWHTIAITNLLSRGNFCKITPQQPPNTTKMATTTPKPVHSLVIDAGPIIKNDPPIGTLISQAEIIYTIPAVVEEIRDEATRARIENTLLPFLKLRSPRPASIKIISDFARKTGDLEVLSKPDIHLMALAYELECERNHGDWRLRSVPGQKRVNGAAPASLKDGTAPVIEEEKTAEAAKAAEAVVPETRGAWGTKIPEKPVVAEEIHLESLDQKLEDTHISTNENQEASIPEPENISTHAEPLVEEVEEVEATESDDDDSDGWITPSNLKKHQEKDQNNAAQPSDEVKTMQVALITSDFAMQNVLLRMNLNLLSPTLQRIRQLKTWVLRCHACFSITKDMAKQFCGRCGKDTLMRTSCSTDKDGNFKVHLKKNMQWNSRGNVYSIPKPVAGTSNGKLVQGGGQGGWGQGLILTEDQKEYVSAMTIGRRKKEKDLMDEDYLPSLLTGARASKSRPKVGAGKNVNSKRRK